MVASVKRTIRIKTSQHVLPDLPPVENFPMRQWSIEIVMLDEEGKEIPATIFDKVVYHLHPTFANPNRTFTEQPFKIVEQGWGGFPLDISVFLLEKAGERKITHDLNFLQEAYEIDHAIQVPTNKPLLAAELAKSGPLEEAPNATKRKAAATNGEPKVKKAKAASASTVKGNVDIEKLAFGLTKLNEDDLVGVVQMVTDNRTPEMNVTNNVEEGEFVIDLYSLPDGLLKSLWDYVKKNTE
ncbi:TAF14 (YPL129W) [Zygosaccharomyces parabailii]|nr:TAF14 (YPL129W) [Zygosaccharomyces parabailii]